MLVSRTRYEKLGTTRQKTVSIVKVECPLDIVNSSITFAGTMTTLLCENDFTPKFYKLNRKGNSGKNH